MTAVVDTDPAPAPGVRAGAFGNATHLVCRECGASTALGPFYACTECFGPLEVGYKFPAMTRERIEAGPRSIWRYAPLLPVPADIATFRSTDPGFTRLVDARNLADDLGLKQLWVKDDSGNPTHSFKDRVVAVALSAARNVRGSTQAWAPIRERASNLISSFEKYVRGLPGAGSSSPG